MLKREATQTQYTIPIDLKQVMDIDNKHENAPDWNWDNYLNNHLDKIEGVFDTDYNGHFGNYIFINVLAEFDTPKTWEDIESTIDNYLKG